MHFQESTSTFFDLAIALLPQADSPILHCVLAWSSESNTRLVQEVAEELPKETTSRDHQVILLVNDNASDAAGVQLVDHFAQLQARHD